MISTHIRAKSLDRARNISNDVIVWGKTPEEHNQNLEALLQRIKELGLTLNRKKCEFAKESLTFQF